MTTERLLKLRPPRQLRMVVFSVIALLMVAVGYLQYHAEKRRVINQQAENLTVVGMLKASQIAEWRKERMADAIRFAQGPALVNPTLRFLKNPTDPEAKDHTQFMLTLNCKGDFYQNALLVSLSGEILLSATNAPEALFPTTHLAVKKALTDLAPTLSGLFRCGLEHEHIDAAAPICDENNQPAAVLILRATVSDSLYPLLHFWPTKSASAETLIVQREGDDVIFLNDVKYSTNSALTMRLPLTQTCLPAVQAVLGVRDIVNGRDYRNVPVLADVRPIPKSDWFMVTKIDQSELYAEIHDRAMTITLFVALGILLAASLTTAGYRRRQSHLYQDLYKVEREQREAHEKFETILYSIGDAVIVTDDKARVSQMNPVAEQLTGWKEAEAIGQALEAVFHIVNEGTRQTVENPVWRVLREGEIVGLANHTILVSRDGTERPIADSGAPVRDEHGTISGVVLVFRDQSQEYAAQKSLRESEAQYSDLFRNMTEGFALHELICDEHGTPVDYRFLKVNPAFERLTGLIADQITGHRIREVMPDIEPHWIKTYGAVAKEGKSARFEDFSLPLGRHFRVTAFCPRLGQFCTIFEDITELKKNEEERKTLENQLHQSQRIEAVGRLAGGVAHDFNNMLAVIVGNAELAKEHLDPSSLLHVDLQEIIKASKRSADLVRQLLAFASRQPIKPRVMDLNVTISGMFNMLQRLIGEEINLDWHPAPDLWHVKLDPSQVDQLLVNLTVNARDAINGIGRISIRTRNVTVSTATDEGVPAEMPSGHYVVLSVSDDGCGMDAETQAHIFEPFFTTKEKEVGTGLGLSTVYGVIKQNHGYISVTSKLGEGTCFDIYLPQHKPAEEAEHTPAIVSGEPRSGSETILLVEDEPALLVLTQTLIKRMGYTVLSACNPDDAIKLSNTYDGPIHLLLTDVVMPEMSGHELWQQLVRERPDLRSLYISGYTANIIAHHGIIESDIHFLQKPFSKEALAAKLREILSPHTPETRRCP